MEGTPTQPGGDWDPEATRVRGQPPAGEPLQPPPGGYPPPPGGLSATPRRVCASLQAGLRQPPAGGGAQGLTVGGTLQAAFDLYRKQAVNLWTIVALIVLPAQVLVFIIERVSLSSNAFASNGTIYTSGSTAVPLLSVVVIGFLAEIIAIGALSKALVDAYTGHPTDWRHSISFAAEHLGPLVLLAIVYVVFLVIGYILFIIPGIYLTVVWSVAVPALVFERIGPMAALGRSRHLVGGRWWATFAVLLVGIIAIIAVSFIVGLILGGIASSSSVTGVLVIAAISRLISALITYPILAALTAVLYVDLRTRKEGFDPRHLSQAPSGAPPPLA